MFYMIKLKSPREIEMMRAAGRLVAEVFAALDDIIEPGVELRELDRFVSGYLKRKGAQPLYKGYRGNLQSSPPFPGVICTSINEEICHGIPNSRRLRESDIVGIDIGLKYRGYCGDACVTYPVGQVSPEAHRLLAITRECLRVGIEAAQPGNFLNEIGRAINGYADSQGVFVVRDLTGHGVGKQLHEPPAVFHVRQPERGPRLRPGMVFTIEPMINLGTHARHTLPDGWTEVTSDGSLSAQFEHTIAITSDGPEILTTL
jgi:methionyl aminopeptidase